MERNQQWEPEGGPITQEERVLILNVLQGEVSCGSGSRRPAIECEHCLRVLAWLVREARKGVGQSEWRTASPYVAKLLNPLMAMDFDKHGNAFVTVVKEPLTQEKPKL